MLYISLKIKNIIKLVDQIIAFEIKTIFVVNDSLCFLFINLFNKSLIVGKPIPPNIINNMIIYTLIGEIIDTLYKFSVYRLKPALQKADIL